MNRSKFSEQEKMKILEEVDSTDLTISAICKKHGISQPTYYMWKRKFSFDSQRDCQRSADESILIEICYKIVENNSQVISILNSIK